ncbi:hypothetical protein [Pedobacter sp. MW01-1-1]|uniref:hypothetical protein n=1 Tax=Pedobacter sp. MW01-1-1 TaxID=3383027 RepID=UPI003FF0A33E
MKDLKKIATEALSFNTHLQEVYVTSDGIAFPALNDAVNHAVKLDDKEVAQFDRVTGSETEIETESTVLAAKDVIALIEKAETEEVVLQILGADERKTVQAAAEKQLAIIKQNVLNAQAYAADLAKETRETENPNTADSTNE